MRRSTPDPLTKITNDQVDFSHPKQLQVFLIMRQKSTKRRNKKGFRKGFRKSQRSRNQRKQYESLEDRHLLATVAQFGGGDLTIDMNAVNDSAFIDTNPSGNVTINGSDQISDGLGGFSTVAASTISGFSVIGSGDSGQSVDFGGAFTTADSTSVADINVTNTESVNFSGAYDLSSALTVSGASDVSVDQFGSLLINGATSITATGTVDFANQFAVNDFVGVVNISANEALVDDANSLDLGTVNVGNLTATALGNISSPSAITTTGVASFDAGADLTIGGVNDFGANDVSLVAGGNATVVGGTTLNLGTVDVLGDFVATAGQNILSTAQTTVGGTTSLTLVDSGTAITFTDANNDFTGAVSVAAGAGPNGSVSLSDTNGLELGSVVAAALDVTAGGNVTGGPLNIHGDASFTSSSGSIVLANVANDFHQNSVSLMAVTDATLSDSNATQLNLGSVVAGGNLAINATGGLTGNDATLVAGSSSITAGGNVNFGDVNNDFGGTATVSLVGDLVLFDATDLDVQLTTSLTNLTLEAGGDLSSLQAVNATGNVDLTSGGNTTFANASNDFSGALAINASGNATVVNATGLILNDSVVSGDASISAGGNITDNQSVQINGTTTLQASGNVELDGSNNNFGGPVSINATGHAVLNDLNDLELGSITATNLTATAGGAISDVGSGDITTGAGELTAQGNLNLTNLNSTFTSLDLEGAAVSVDSSAALTISSLVTSQPSAISTTQDLTMTAATISSAGDVSFNANNVNFDSSVIVGGGDFNVVAVGNSSFQISSFAIVGRTQIQSTGSSVFAGTFNTDEFDLDSANTDWNNASFNTTGDTTVNLTGDLTAVSSQVQHNGAGNVSVDGNLVTLTDSAIGSANADVTIDVQSMVLNGANTLAADGDFSLTTLTNLNLTNAVIDNDGTNSTFAANAPNVTADNLSNSLNRFTSNASGTVDVFSTSSIEVGNIQNANSLIIQTSGGVTQQTGSSVVVVGATNISTAGDVTLDSPTNDFQGGITFLPNVSVNVADLNDLNLGSAQFNNLTLNTGGVASWGNITVTGQLDVTAGGDINGNQTSVSLATTLNAVGDITLNDANNQFGSSVTATGATNNFVATGSLLLGDLTSTQLNLTADSISQVAASSVTTSGLTTITSAGAVDLSQLNDFQGRFDVSATGQSVSVNDSGTLDLGTIAADSFNVSGEAVSDSGVASVSTTTINTTGHVALDSASSQFGALDINAGSLAIATTPSLNFAGLDTITNANISSAADVTLAGITSTIGGDLTVTGQNIDFSNSTLNVTGQINTNSTATAGFSGGTVTAGAVSISATDINLQGQITSDSLIAQATQSILANNADLTTTSSMTLDAASTIELSDATINQGSGSFTLDASTLQFQRTTVAANNVSVTADAFNVSDANSVTVLGDLDVSSPNAINLNIQFDVQGQSDLNAPGVVVGNSSNDFGGAVNSNAVGAVSIVDNSDIVLGNFLTPASLNVQAGGAISQLGGTTINSPSSTSLAATGNVTLDSPTNEFGDGSSFSVAFNGANQNLELADATSFDLGTVAFPGDVAIVTGADITAQNLTVAGDASFDAGGDISLATGLNDFAGSVHATANDNPTQVVNISDTNQLRLGNFDVAGNVQLSAGAELNQAAGTAVDVAGQSSLTAGGDILLNNSGNDFGGVVDFGFTGANQETLLTDVNDLTIGNVTFPDEVHLVAGGDLSGGQVVSNGPATLEAGGTITMTNAGNDFAVDLDLTATNATIFDSNGFTFGDANIGANLDVTANGDISGSVTDTIIVGGETTLAAGGFNVTLDSPTNDFQGAVNVTGGAVTLTDANHLELGQINATELDISAGSIADETGATIAVANQAGFSATGNVTVNNSNNDFQGVVSVAGSDVTITDTNDLLLQTANVSDDIILNTGGNLELETLNIADDLTANVAGNITDSVAAAIDIGDRANLNVNGDITLDHNNNQFRGRVDIGGQTNSEASNATIVDNGDLTFEDVFVANNLNVTTSGTITNVNNSNIEVGNNATLESDRVIFGNKSGDSIEFERLSLNTTSLADIRQDNDVRLLNTTAGTLRVTSTGRITNGITSQINVANDATFSGSSIQIGSQANDQFNANRLNVNSSGTVVIEEASGSTLFGENTARNFELISNGDIVDHDTAAIDVDNLFELEGDSILLGDSLNDQFNAGLLEFVSSGDTSIAEDSRINLFGDSSAANATLSSTNAIVDSTTATTNIAGLATLDALFVILGDASNDELNTGSVNFNTSGNFRMIENSDLSIVGANTANSVFMQADGSLTNTENATLNTTASGNFVADGISLGNQVGDQFNVSALSFSSSGAVTIHEDSGMLLIGVNTANTLELTSTANLIDGSTTSTNVTGLASLEAASIRLGDSAFDTFNTGTINLNSPGNIVIGEDSNLTLVGDNTARHLTLTANGFIGDSATSTTNIEGFLIVTADLVNLGSDFDANLDPQLRFSKLTVNTTGNANITSATSFSLEGNSNVGDRLILTSDGDITDSPTAVTIIENVARLIAQDIILGELETDCFDILAGIDGLFVNAAGEANIHLGC